MQQAVRSRMATGVVFAGVSALVVSPIAPQLSEMAALPTPSSVQVELTTLVNPIVEYGEVFSKAFENAVALGDRIAADPTPILTQIIRNQLASAAGVSTFVSTAANTLVKTLGESPEQVRTALEQFEAGNVSGALNTLMNTALGPIVQVVADTLLFNPAIWTGLTDAIRKPIANTLAVVDLLAVPQVFNLLAPILAPVQLITDVTAAVGAAGDDIVAGLKAGDYEKVANAILSAGPAVTDAFINGTANSVTGLLGQNGIVAGLLTIRDQIADAITPPAATSKIAIDAPATAALDAAPETESAPALTGATPETQAETVAAVSTAPAVAEKPAAQTVSTSSETTNTEESTETTTATDGVKDSPKAVPGKTGTDNGDKVGREVTKVRDGIRGALKGLANGLKDASDKLTGKTAKPAKADSSTGSTSGSGDSASSDKPSGDKE